MENILEAAEFSVEQIKKLRKELQVIAYNVQWLESERSARSTQVEPYTGGTVGCLQRAKRWLGEVLKAMGETNPYPTSMDSSSTTIEPTADVPETFPIFIEGQQTERDFVIIGTKLLRQRIQDCITMVNPDVSPVIDCGVCNICVAWMQVYISLVDAKGLLGELLGAINNGTNETR